MILDKNILCEDGQFGCPICKGKGVVFSRRRGIEHMCSGCLGTGHLVDYLGFMLDCERTAHNMVQNKYNELTVWLKNNSTCQTCGGNPFKTIGDESCSECGLKGSGYIPG